MRHAARSRSFPQPQTTGLHAGPMLLTRFPRGKPRPSGRGSSAPQDLLYLVRSNEPQDTAHACAGYVASTAEIAWQVSPAQGGQQQEPAEETPNNHGRSVGIPAIDGGEDVKARLAPGLRCRIERLREGGGRV
jgi:hypothetical protein